MSNYADLSAVITARVSTAVLQPNEEGKAFEAAQAFNVQPLAPGKTDVPVDTGLLDLEFEDENNFLPFIDWAIGKFTLIPRRLGAKIFIRNETIDTSPIPPVEYLTSRLENAYWSKLLKVLVNSATAATQYGYPSLTVGATEAGKGSVTAANPAALALAVIEELEASGIYEATGLLYNGSVADFVNAGTSFQTPVLTYDAAGNPLVWGYRLHLVPRDTFTAPKTIMAVDRRFIVVGPSGNTKVTIDQGTSAQRTGATVNQVRDAVEEDAIRLVPQLWFGYALWGPKEDDAYTDFPAAFGTLAEVSA